MSVGLLDDLRDGIMLNLAPLSVGQYQQMIRDGILHDGEAIELIQGALFYKDRRDEQGSIMTHGPRHLRSVNKLMALLSQWVASRQAFLQVQGPIVVADTSEPEPDCCLIRGTPDDFVDRVPTASDALAVFEVSFSSLPSDRRTKQRLYAGASIPVYVIVNLQDNLIEVMSEPSAAEGRYLNQSISHPSETVVVTLADLGELSFAGTNLL